MIGVSVAPRLWWSHYFPPMKRTSWLGPPNHPEAAILPEMAEAGYAGTPPRAEGGRSAQETAAVYRTYGLIPTPGSIGRLVEWWRHGEREAQVEVAASEARTHRELGLKALIVVPQLTPQRRAVAGRPGRADRISDAEFQRLADILNAMGEVTLREGVYLSFHSHVGSHVETRDEIDKLFEMVDRALVFQGPDIGHLAWAGADIVEFVRDYAQDIKVMHIKDIDGAVRERGIAEGWDYEDFSERGLYAELGRGIVDFPAMFEILRTSGFDGWVEVGTDVTTRPTPLESARMSREYLRSLGV